jgi:hypothetical protein
MAVRDRVLEELLRQRAELPSMRVEALSPIAYCWPGDVVTGAKPTSRSRSPREVPVDARDVERAGRQRHARADRRLRCRCSSSLIFGATTS